MWSRQERHQRRKAKSQQLMNLPASCYWSCACVRRDADGAVRAIKTNHPQIQRCQVCKMWRPDEWVKEQVEEVLKKKMRESQ